MVFPNKVTTQIPALTPTLGARDSRAGGAHTVPEEKSAVSHLKSILTKTLPGRAGSTAHLPQNMSFPELSPIEGQAVVPHNHG